jgi:transcriptional regulator with XRE-family HTH domain
VTMGPTVRRRRLGSELRKLREDHSIKLEEVAESLGVAASTLSRIETGKAPTKSIYLTAMLDLYGVSDSSQRQILVDMAREGHRKGWWSVYDDVLPTGLGIYIGLEAEAASVRSFEGEVIHGLFQTPDYARAILREVQVRDTDEQVERLVDLRMKRQDVLERDPPLDVWLILDEAVIRRTIGGPEIMHGQLARLVEASKKPHVTLQVLPFSSGSHAGLRGSFSILEFPERADSDVAYVESVAGIIYLEKEREVRICAEAFDRLRAAALSPGQSTDLIYGAANELESSA